jgi:ornithine cyclodeaminase/alanine dehydrogenase
VQVFDIRRSAAEKYAEDMKNIVQGPIVVASRARKAAVDVDVVVCVTHAPTTVSSATRGLSPGPFFSPGSYQECERSVHSYGGTNRRRHVGQTLHPRRAGQTGASGRITEKNIYATVGEIAAGKKPGLFFPAAMNVSCAFR